MLTLPILALMKASTPEKSRFSPTRSCFPRFPKSMSGLTTSLVLFNHGLASNSSTKLVSARTCCQRPQSALVLALQEHSQA